MAQKPEQLIDLVERMREAQDKYFLHRSQSDLLRAKSLEHQVDAWLTAWRNREKLEQQTLFPQRMN